MERALILEGVRRVLSEHLAIRDVTEETHILSDLKLDSIQQLTFVVELENQFRVRFDEGDETGIDTIGDVVEAVARRLEGRAAPEPGAEAGPGAPKPPAKADS